MTDAIDRATAYKGECLLLRWGENPKGRTVTFQLDPLVGSQHPFKNLKCGENGQRLMLVAVLIGDDEQPQAKIEAPARSNDPVPIHKAKPFRELPRSQQAALKCQDVAFCDWLEGAVDHELDHAEFLDEASFANAVLKEHLGITSKRELDVMPNKASAWDSLLTSYETETRYGVS